MVADGLQEVNTHAEWHDVVIGGEIRNEIRNCTVERTGFDATRFRVLPSHLVPRTSWTLPFRRAPFRGQSPPPPPRGPPSGEGRQFTPVHEPVETAHTNSCMSSLTEGFMGQSAA